MKNGSGKIVARLLAAVLRKGKLARDCPSRMLEEICKETESYGAVLWQATENAEPKAVPPKGHLFMLATWFPRGAAFAIHNLGLERTVAGPAVCRGKPSIVNDIRSKGGTHKDHEFLRKHDLNRVVAFPFKFSDGTLGALTLYRKETAKLFLSSDLRLLKSAFAVLPALLSQSQERSRLELLADITSLFHTKDLSVPDRSNREKSWGRILNEICKRLEKVFHLAEASIILRNQEKSDDFVVKSVKTSPGHGKLILRHRWRDDIREGTFTSLCLGSRQSVRLFDMCHCQGDVERIQRDYPEFAWKHEGSIDQEARDALGPKYADAAEELPPLAFLAVPIVNGDRLHGCIRCWIAKPPLSYFSPHDEELLELVAAQIALHLEALQHENETSTEVDVWRGLSDVGLRMGTEPEVVEVKDKRPLGRTPGVDTFTTFLLNRMRALIPSAELIALWLSDEKGGEMSCVAATMLHPTEDRAVEILSVWQAYVSRRVPLKDSDLLAVTFQKREHLSYDVNDPIASRCQHLPKVKKAIALPVMTQDKIFGVLHVGSAKDEPFPPFAVQAASFISNLLAYHLQAQRAKSEAERLQLQRAQMEKFTNEAFRDIMHQVKGPLIECAKRIWEIGEELGDHSALGRRVKLAAEMAESASRVSRRVGILAQLADKSSIQASRQVLGRPEVVSLVRDAVRNVSYRIHPARKIRFEADFEHLGSVIPDQVVIDPELFLHALQNIIDNAAKYSYPDNPVRLVGMRSSKDGWMIGVLNKGIPIKASEVRLVRQRNWRGQLAQLSTGEGSGIGLWIVDRICLALQGGLHIHPTNEAGWTQVVLSFHSQPLISRA